MPGLLALALISGCAHAPRGAADESRVEPAEESADRSEQGPGSSGYPDPSEAITPEELASIPDPVPGRPDDPGASAGAREATNGGGPGSEPSSAGTTSPGAPETGADGGGAAAGAWRVQVFASESRAEAERVSREASARLGVDSAVQFEAPLYKVRLGRFTRESDAQALRQRAIDAGYSGAFRIRTAALSGDGAEPGE